MLPPATALRAFIRYYVIAEIKLDSNMPVLQEFPPLNITALSLFEFPKMLDYRADGWDLKTKSMESAFVGPMTTWSETWMLRPGKMVSVHFHETGIFRFFGLPLSAFLNTASDAPATLDAQEIIHLREKIFNLSNPMDIVACLNHFFCNKLSTQKDRMNNMDTIARFVNSRKGNINIDWLMIQANMSAKTLERQFHEKIGFTPKFYTRIVRFSHAMKMLTQNKGVFDIIVDCGYTDQAHFIKEISLFTGRTPKFYYNLDTEEELPVRLLLDNRP